MARIMPLGLHLSFVCILVSSFWGLSLGRFSEQAYLCELSNSREKRALLFQVMELTLG